MVLQFPGVFLCFMSVQNGFESIYVLLLLIFSSFLFLPCRRHIYLANSPLCCLQGVCVLYFCQGLGLLPCVFEAVFLLLVVFSLHVIKKLLLRGVFTERRCLDNFFKQNLIRCISCRWQSWLLFTQRDSRPALCSRLCLFMYVYRRNIFNTACIFYRIVWSKPVS